MVTVDMLGERPDATTFVSVSMVVTVSLCAFRWTDSCAPVFFKECVDRRRGGGGYRGHVGRDAHAVRRGHGRDHIVISFSRVVTVYACTFTRAGQCAHTLFKDVTVCVQDTIVCVRDGGMWLLTGDMLGERRAPFDVFLGSLQCSLNGRDRV